jgi:hypothetical protein
MIRLALLSLVVAGCGSDPVKKLDVYKYRVHVDQPTDAKHHLSSDFTLKIGTTTYAVKSGEVSIPAAQYLTKNPLSMVLETTCGPLDVPLTNVYNDEDQMRDSAAKYDQAISWKLEMKTALDVKSVGVIVDNLDNPSPVTVRVGTIAKEIAAKSHGYSGGVLGSCDTAREVAVADKVLGIAKTDGTTTLVDVLGTHCYASSRDSYGSMPVEPTRDILVAYAPQLYTIGDIDNWFTPNPTSTTIRVRENEAATAGTTLTSLTHTTCPSRAARKTR